MQFADVNLNFSMTRYDFAKIREPLFAVEFFSTFSLNFVLLLRC